MALTEEIVNDKIEVINNGSWSCVQVRTASVIKRDGGEISRSFHRHVVMPNADLSAEDSDVSAICATVFTQACKDAYAVAAQE
jgi:predicted metal-dependent TIM-barrel fold hydrolase